jgi:hypothetical protein
MREMTSKERIIASLNFEETDRLCYSPLADNYFATSLPKQGYEYDLFKALRYIGCDIMERHSQCCREYFDGNVEMRTETDGFRHMTIYETPVGKISNRFGTRVTAIQKLNNMTGTNIRVNQVIQIPATAKAREYAKDPEAFFRKPSTPRRNNRRR